VTNLWYLYINILCLLCKYITEGSVHLQHNVMLYISKHLLQKMQGIAAIGVEKCPTIKCDITPNFLLPTNHLSFLHIRYSMVPFCRSPPPLTDEFLKNALRLNSLRSRSKAQSKRNKCYRNPVQISQFITITISGG
jgi:hypothetical protein